MLKELLEGKNFTVFTILDNGTEVFQTKSNNGADVIDRKLKTKKFQKMKDLKIIRVSGEGQKDVTDLFIKESMSEGKGQEYYFVCMDCDYDWEEIHTDDKFPDDLDFGANGCCPKCYSSDISIENEDGEVWDGEDFRG